MMRISEQLMRELLLRAASVEFYADGSVKRIEFRNPAPTPPTPKRMSVEVRTQRISTKTRAV